MSLSEKLKTIFLATLIALALSLKAHHAKAAETQVLTVAGGCFWCVEADFEKVPGVSGVVSGFTGGDVANPTYRQVVGGGTGHYEAVQIAFDPDKVSRAKLLSLFFRSVDPTDAGGQFCDRGPAYRTAVFVAGDAEKKLAEQAKAEAQRALGQKVVTPVLALGAFYPAEAYHQDYYKSDALIITRFGPRKKATAYKLYRDSCGRDTRVRQLWGSDAPFVGG